jgi:hypothetical protein
MIIRTRCDDGALRAKDRVAAFGSQARAVLAVGECERGRACEGIENFAPKR